MGDTIRQHYVPRQYLKRFSFDGKRIYTFLLKNSICEPKGLADVCVSKKYYTLSPNTVKLGYSPMMLEKDYFQDYAEPNLNEGIKAIEQYVLEFQKLKVTSAYLDIPIGLRRLLIETVFIQYYRSPQQRKVYNDIGYVINEQCKILKERNNLSPTDIPKPDIPFIHAEKTLFNLSLLKKFLDKLFSYSMLIRVSDNGNFFTSDNPVVIHKLGAKGKNIIKNINIFTDDISVFFPLTPNIILEFYNPLIFQGTANWDSTISIVHTDYENQVNKYQYINAENFVFSYKNDFSLFLKTFE